MPDPDLLILDEPTVGMDVEIRRAFWASMQDFIGVGRTVLFATHYLDEADAVADRIVVLDAGPVVADGTAAEIKARVAGRTVAVAADSVDPIAAGSLPEVARDRAQRLPAAAAHRRLRRPAPGPAGRANPRLATSRSPRPGSRTPSSP